MSEAAPTRTAPRPVTLFTGPWADLPFEQVARIAGVPQALALVGELARIDPSAAAFDAAFSARSASTHEISDHATTKEGS